MHCSKGRRASLDEISSLGASLLACYPVFCLINDVRDERKKEKEDAMATLTDKGVQEYMRDT